MPATRTTRSTAAAAGVSKKVHRKARPARQPSDSWELLDRQGLDPYADEENDQDYGNDNDAVDVSPVDVRETVNTLRQAAERVGKEVEAFAVTVDRFFEELPTVSSRYNAARDLIMEFKRHANEEVAVLKQTHERETREHLKKEWSEQARISAAMTGSQALTTSKSVASSEHQTSRVKQLRRWQQEADIWELFRIMLELHPFEDDAKAIRAEREETFAKLGPVHRYTSESELWDRFLLDNDLGRERHMIKKWLEQAADHQGSDVQGIVEELEAKAGRGKGLWSSGWLHTREKIKGEKRLRTWPSAADSPLPQIHRSDNNDLLVTTLDPDAPLRQKRTLEKPDAYFERAVWVACWEMLRRGQTSNAICDWCVDRKEGWRALCMGSASDVSDLQAPHAAWRQMCALVSKSGCSTDYESAVFGVLGGNVKAAEKVCRTIDDHLYVHYSSVLLHQFNDFVQSVSPDNASGIPRQRESTNDNLFDPEHAQQAINDLIVHLRQRASTKEEAAEPMKVIQSFLLADEVGSLIHTVGTSIAETDVVKHSKDHLFFRHERSHANDRPENELTVALDQQSLRITTHMSLIHRVLSPNHLEGDELKIDENVLIGYIQALRAASRRMLIPTYASRLSKQCGVQVMSHVLQDVTDSQEQLQMVRLLEHVNFDSVAIFEAQLERLLAASLPGDEPKAALNMLEPATKGQALHPGIRIRADFLPKSVMMEDEAVVQALQWFKLIKGGWDVTFKALTLALRTCLVHGRFASARNIIDNFPFDEISKSKSYQSLRQVVNIMDDEMFVPRDDTERMQYDVMRRQSRTYYELEQLIHAVESLDAWRAEEVSHTDAPLKANKTPASIKDLKEEMVATMSPLLRGILLNPTDEEEAKDLAKISVMYVPEIVIAYAVALHSAGLMVSREALLDSMEMSTIIATGKSSHDAKESNGLAECFVKAGRMRELMQVFAETSKTMLVSRAEHGPLKQKRDRIGKLEIWEIGTAASAVG